MATQTVARLRYVSIPPRKMRVVADLVKGLPIEKALDILNYTPRIAARHLAKTLKSAAANALSLEGTDHLKPEDLRVKNIIVDEAPTQKRIRFQSMGRVFRYRKRYSHLTVILEEQVQVEEPRPKARPTRKKAKAADAEAEPEAGTKTRKTAKKKATTKKKAAAKKTAGKKKESRAESKESAGTAKPKKTASKKAETKADAGSEKAEAESNKKNEEK
ncbi:MAG: 50S ribosomal protein L22 [Candidatus Zixiibacteriota bacterium]